jgi:hypothetical protein
MGAFLPGSEVTSVEANNLDDVEQKVGIHIRGKTSQLARSDGDGLSVPLNRREHMVRDYASLAARTVDVRIAAQTTELDDWTVHLPPGAKPRGVPSPVHGSGPFGSYSLEVESSPTTIHVKTTVSVSKTRVPSGEYRAFRAWCEEVDHVLGQRASVTPR